MDQALLILIGSWILVVVWVLGVILIQKKQHPEALFILFLTEMWERFSYYGMRALLVLYLVSEITKGGLGWTSAQAGQLYGIYTGLVYVTPLIGGYLADRFLGHRAAIFIGGIIMAIGHATLAIDMMPTFYLGLLLLIIGNGFFKPNISSLVGQLYPQGSPIKDSAYTIFYMGVNLGAFLGGITCGYLGENIGWHYGFGAAGVGMCLGLIVFYLGKSKLGEVGKKVEITTENKLTDSIPLTSLEKDRLKVIAALSFFSIIFWIAFEQAGSSLNIYAYKFTDRTIGASNYEIPASFFQSVNPLFIMLLAPLFSWIWLSLAKTNNNPNGPMKFALGFVLLGLGFVALVIGASSIPKGATSGSAHLLWLVLAYLLHTMGELCISPVGLSFVSKLSPLKFVGIMFGIWLFASAIGNYISGFLSGFIDQLAQEQSLSIFFAMFVGISLAGAVLAACMSPLLKKWMHGVK
ncbi:MAG TPA: peptide MFS transporter [Cytophagaceae bacterium]